VEARGIAAAVEEDEEQEADDLIRSWGFKPDKLPNHNDNDNDDDNYNQKA
jgi:hypothetical protein